LDTQAAARPHSRERREGRRPSASSCVAWGLGVWPSGEESRGAALTRSSLPGRDRLRAAAKWAVCWASSLTACASFLRVPVRMSLVAVG
jgi:hypothetical protein